ncbi:MAG: PQQ-like beta-propeller repeat protein, partial [Bifidobacteriaceae bacterium]|nr:PQQ-like beta-propeller repeat protein [Bifidobacteriaceae bacterium]
MAAASMVAGGALAFAAARLDLFGGAGGGASGVMDDPGGDIFAQSGDRAADQLEVVNAPDLTPAPATFADGAVEVWEARLDWQALAVSPGKVVAIGPAGSGQEFKTAFDRVTGEQVWTVTMDNYGVMGCDDSDSADRMVCYGGADGGHPYLIDLTTGEKLPIDLNTPWAEQWGFSSGVILIGEDVLAVQMIGGNGAPVEGYQAALFGGDGAVKWEGPVLQRAEDVGRSPLVARGGIVGGAGLPMALDLATGVNLVEGVADCASPQIYPGRQIWCSSGEADRPPQEVSPGGAEPATIHFGLVQTIDGEYPDEVVLTWTGGPWWEFEASDPATEARLWDGRTISIKDRLLAWNGGDLLAEYDFSDGSVTFIDLATGGAVATAAGPPLAGAAEAISAQFIDQFAFALVEDVGARRATVFDARTGQVAAELEADFFKLSRHLLPGSAYILDGHNWDHQPDTGSLRYLAPAAASGQPVEPVAAPGDLPGCPSGMDTLAWSQFEGGWVVVCASAEGAYAVAARSDGRDLAPVVLTFTDGGCRVESADGGTLTLALGGSYALLPGGEVAAAQQSWHYATGSGEFSDPPPTSELACPAGSWPISLATYHDGWVLVCGTALDRATLMRWADGQLGGGEAEAVEAEAAGWCAITGQIRTCSFPTPALVAYTESGAAGASQRPVASNFFDGIGVGRTGEGKGAYDVEAPDSTAQDQVRYLVEVLNASAVDRTDVAVYIEQVEAGAVTDATVAGFERVAASRARLASAVESAPVSEVEGGSAL